MNAARGPRAPSARRLLLVDPVSERIRDGRPADLARVLGAGDVLVLNDAATLPAALRGHDDRGRAVEARLTGPPVGGRAPAVLFGDGTWRDDTDLRPAPPVLRPGTTLSFGGVEATVVSVSPDSPRLVEIAFPGKAPWDALYEGGSAVQYRYLSRPWSLGAFQNAFASRPWAVEVPSAGFALDWDLLLALRRRGVVLAPITCAAGLSSTGDRALDRRLPFPERFEVPAATARALAAARRVVAVGTSAARAVEAWAAAGRPAGGTSGTVDLRLGPAVRPLCTDGILTNLHAPGEPHYELLRAFAPDRLLRRAIGRAARAGYLVHEFGDHLIVVPACVAADRVTGVAMLPADPSLRTSPSPAGTTMPEPVLAAPGTQIVR